MLEQKEIVTLGLVSVLRSVKVSTVFSGIFGGLGEIDSFYSIELKGVAVLYRVDLPRRLAMGVCQGTKVELA